MRVDRARGPAGAGVRDDAGARDAAPKAPGRRFRACLEAEQKRLDASGATAASTASAPADAAAGLAPPGGAPVPGAPLAPAPVTAATPPAGDTSAVRAAIVWAARSAVAAAASPGELRLALEDRRLGRIGIRVRVAAGRRVRVALSAPRPVLGRLLSEAPALAGDLAARGLVLAALRSE